jgi:hypothetical protein
MSAPVVLPGPSPALVAELLAVAWHPSVRKRYDGTDATYPAPPYWLGESRLTANLAGLRLGPGFHAIAGVERWAVVAVRTQHGIEWAVACLGAV